MHTSLCGLSILEEMHSKFRPCLPRLVAVVCLRGKFCRTRCVKDNISLGSPYFWSWEKVQNYPAPKTSTSIGSLYAQHDPLGNTSKQQRGSSFTNDSQRFQRPLNSLTNTTCDKPTRA